MAGCCKGGRNCCGHFWSFVLNIFLYIIDIGSDVALCIQYYQDGRLIWFGLTLAILLFSGILTSVLVAYIKCYYGGFHCKRANIGLALCCVFMITPLYYRIRSFHKRLHPNEKNNEDKKTEEAVQSAEFQLIERYLEGAPQLFLQFYITIVTGITGLNFLTVLQILSMVTSLVSLAWVQVEYANLQRWEKPLAFFQHSFYIVSRAFSVCFFASVFGWVVFIILAVHYIVQFLVVLVLFRRQDNSTLFGDIYFATAESLLKTVTCAWLSFGSKPDIWRYLSECISLYIENLAMISLWYLSVFHRKLWYHEPVLIFVIFGFFMAVLLEVVVQRKFVKELNLCSLKRYKSASRLTQYEIDVESRPSIENDQLKQLTR